MITCEIAQKGIGIKTQLCKLGVCDTSIARVTGCVYPREWYRQVGDPPADARVNRTKTSTLFCARKLYNLHWGGQKQASIFWIQYAWNNKCYTSK